MRLIPIGRARIPQDTPRLLNELLDHLQSEATLPGTISGNVQTANGEPAPTVWVSDFYPGIVVTTAGIRVRHALGAIPKYVSVNYTEGAATGSVFFPKQPDAKYIYLDVTSGTRTVWLKAEV
jgi:hypothetical protein